MKKGASKISRLSSIFCIAILLFPLALPFTCFGQDTPCPMSVDVSPYQVNIDSGGAEHNVRVLTYAWYRDTSEAFVYINSDALPIEPEYIILTRDSVGHLVVKIDLIAFQVEELEVNMIHELKIVTTLKEPTDGCVEKEGIGEVYIIGKKAAKEGE
jgi:hypothetical protein